MVGSEMDFIIPTRLINQKSIDKIWKDRYTWLQDDPGNQTSPILVYQHPLDKIDVKFEEYCFNNSDLIKKSRILISLPISYIEQNCNAIDGLLKAFITSLNDIGFQLNGEVKLIYNRDIDKKLQHQVDDPHLC